MVQCKKKIAVKKVKANPSQYTQYKITQLPLSAVVPFPRSTGCCYEQPHGHFIHTGFHIQINSCRYNILLTASPYPRCTYCKVFISSTSYVLAKILLFDFPCTWLGIPLFPLHSLFKIKVHFSKWTGTPLVDEHQWIYHSHYNCWIICFSEICSCMPTITTMYSIIWVENSSCVERKKFWGIKAINLKKIIM